MFCRLRLCLAILAIVVSPCAAVAQAVGWYARPHLQRAYDLRGKTVLVVVANDFNFGESVEMAQCWKGWGATVEFAGPEPMMTGEIEEATTPTGASRAPRIQVDHLLPDVDPSQYDVIFFAGGEGIPSLLNGHRHQLSRIIDTADAQRKIIAAICHGPMALAASSIVKGRKLTAQGSEQRRSLQEAGAQVVSEITVVDDRLVTGQWPHLEEFAVTLAERLQFPSGGGPRERALSGRTDVQRSIDDQRDCYAFDSREVTPQTLEALARAAQRALGPRGSATSGPIKYVAVRSPHTKMALAAALWEKARPLLLSRGGPEDAARTEFAATIERVPLLLLQFVELGKDEPGIGRERQLLVHGARAGAASANLILAARSLALGVSMVAWQAIPGADGVICDLVGAPDGARLVGMFGVGYPSLTGIPVVTVPAAEVMFSDQWPKR